MSHIAGRFFSMEPPENLHDNKMPKQLVGVVGLRGSDVVGSVLLEGRGLMGGGKETDLYSGLPRAEIHAVKPHQLPIFVCQLTYS